MGTPKNLTYPAPYNNLGIPGAKAQDVLATKTVCGYNPFSPTCTNPYYDLVLRNQPTLPTYTAVEQAIAQNPTFVVLWAGNNDVLGAATNGAAVDRVTLTPAADVDLSLRTIIGALKAHTQAKILLVNLPDAGAIPFVTTIPSILLDPITSDPVLDSGGHPISLVGQKQGELPGTIPAGTRVTLGASSLMKGKCLGIPVGKSATWDAYCSTLTLNLQGYPLPDGGMVNGNFQPGVLLYSDEINAITSRTQEINTRIAAIGTEMGIPVLDINGIFRDAAEDGLVFGGVDFNAEFLTGGLFSFDGVHLTNLGYAIVANEMVKAVDIYWNLDIPQVDLYPYMFGSTSAAWLVGSNAPFLYSEEAVEQIRKLFPPTLPAVVLDLDRKDLPLRETGNIK
jgi:lysophospholipase L1-like esterase